jgi:primosomal replication protein N''
VPFASCHSTLRCCTRFADVLQFSYGTGELPSGKSHGSRSAKDGCGPPLQIPTEGFGPSRLSAASWLAARFEGNPLHALKAFPADPATLRAFLSDFERFAAAEAQRQGLISQAAAAFEVTDAESTRVWVSEASKRIALLSAEQRGNIALWISLFAPGVGARAGKAEGRKQLEELDELVVLLETSGPSLPSSEMASILLALDDDTLRALSRACDRALAPASLIGLLNPLRYFALRQLRRFLRERAPGMAGDVPALIGAVRFERELRILKQRLAVVLVQLKIDNLTLTSLPWVGVTRLATHLRQSLGDVEAIARLLERGPRIDLALRHAEAGTLPAFLDEVASAVRRCDTRMASAAALVALGSWFEDPWLSACRSAIPTGQSNMSPLATIAGALPTILARSRSKIGGSTVFSAANIHVIARARAFASCGSKPAWRSATWNTIAPDSNRASSPSS